MLRLVGFRRQVFRDTRGSNVLWKNREGYLFSVSVITSPK
jgi:hypothetical protein